MLEYSEEESTLLQLLKEMYWKESPLITRCQAVMYFSQTWPGRPESLPSLSNALSSFVTRNYLTLADGRYCLTGLGEQAIGAKPPSDPSATS